MDERDLNLHEFSQNYEEIAEEHERNFPCLHGYQNVIFFIGGLRELPKNTSGARPALKSNLNTYLSLAFTADL